MLHWGRPRRCGARSGSSLRPTSARVHQRPARSIVMAPHPERLGRVVDGTRLEPDTTSVCSGRVVSMTSAQPGCSAGAGGRGWSVDRRGLAHGDDRLPAASRPLTGPNPNLWHLGRGHFAPDEGRPERLPRRYSQPPPDPGVNLRRLRSEFQFHGERGHRHRGRSLVGTGTGPATARLLRAAIRSDQHVDALRRRGTATHRSSLTLCPTAKGRRPKVAGHAGLLTNPTEVCGSSTTWPGRWSSPSGAAQAQEPTRWRAAAR